MASLEGGMVRLGPFSVVLPSGIKIGGNTQERVLPLCCFLFCYLLFLFLLLFVVNVSCEKNCDPLMDTLRAASEDCSLAVVLVWFPDLKLTLRCSGVTILVGMAQLHVVLPNMVGLNLIETGSGFLGEQCAGAGMILGCPLRGIFLLELILFLLGLPLFWFLSFSGTSWTLPNKMYTSCTKSMYQPIGALGLANQNVL